MGIGKASSIRARRQWKLTLVNKNPLKPAVHVKYDIIKNVQNTR